MPAHWFCFLTFRYTSIRIADEQSIKYMILFYMDLFSIFAHSVSDHILFAIQHFIFNFDAIEAHDIFIYHRWLDVGCWAELMRTRENVWPLRAEARARMPQLCACVCNDPMRADGEYLTRARKRRHKNKDHIRIDALHCKRLCLLFWWQWLLHIARFGFGCERVP